MGIFWYLILLNLENKRNVLRPLELLAASSLPTTLCPPVAWYRPRLSSRRGRAAVRDWWRRQAVLWARILALAGQSLDVVMSGGLSRQIGIAFCFESRVRWASDSPVSLQAKIRFPRYHTLESSAKVGEITNWEKVLHTFNLSSTHFESLLPEKLFGLLLWAVLGIIGLHFALLILHQCYWLLENRCCLTNWWHQRGVWTNSPKIWQSERC